MYAEATDCADFIPSAGHAYPCSSVAYFQVRPTTALQTFAHLADDTATAEGIKNRIPHIDQHSDKKFGRWRGSVSDGVRFEMFLATPVGQSGQFVPCIYIQAAPPEGRGADVDFKAKTVKSAALSALSKKADYRMPSGKHRISLVAGIQAQGKELPEHIRIIVEGAIGACSNGI